jgi:hypothetical protein
VVHPTLSAVRGLTPIIAKHAKNRNAKSWQGERLPHLQPPRLTRLPPNDGDSSNGDEPWKGVQDPGVDNEIVVVQVFRLSMRISRWPQTTRIR